MADWENNHLAEQDEKIADLARRLAEAEAAARDEYRACAVEQDYWRNDFICAMWTQVDRYEKDRADLNATCAALAVGVKREAERAEAAEARVRELEAELRAVQARAAWGDVTPKTTERNRRKRNRRRVRG